MSPPAPVNHWTHWSLLILISGLGKSMQTKQDTQMHTNSDDTSRR